MKQAVLVTAYKDIAHLRRIAAYFGHGFELYIHVDRKSAVSATELSELGSMPAVARISRRFRVNWGGRNHLRSILHLVRESLKNPELEYFHLISGQDFPTRSLESFDEFFRVNRGVDFLEHFSLPADCWDGGGLDRIRYFQPYDLIDAKRSMHRIRSLLRLQQRLGISRPIPKELPKLYGGSTYWSLGRPTVQLVHDYTIRHPQLLRRLIHTFCSEELYFQTVVLNADSARRISGFNLRYIKWPARDEPASGGPAVLDEHDFLPIRQSEAFFARKFDHPKSDNLLAMLLEGSRGSD